MIGIVFATLREARPFMQNFGMKAKDSGIVVYICGMGPEKAVSGIKQLVKRHKLSSVINAGIAGALKRDFNIGSVVNVIKVVNQAANRYYMPDGADLWKALPPAVLITSPEPVFNESKRSQLAKLADIVDMEGAEIARVCKKEKIKFSAIKAISDFAGENDRTQLYKHIDNLSLLLAGILAQKLLEDKNIIC